MNDLNCIINSATLCEFYIYRCIAWRKCHSHDNESLNPNYDLVLGTLRGVNNPFSHILQLCMCK